MIRFNGHYDGKVITPDEPVDIPPGRPLRVTVEDIEAADRPHSSRETLLRLAREAEAMAVDFPEDFAAQHNHYIHGAPRR